METDQSAVRVEMPSEEQDNKMDDSMDVEQDVCFVLNFYLPTNKLYFNFSLLKRVSCF